MELSPLTIYLISLADDLKCLCGMVAVATSIPILVSSVCFISDRECFNDIKRGVKKVAWVFVTAATMTVITPSSKTLVAMYVLPAIVNNERVQNISVDLMKLAEKWVKEQLGEKENHEPQRSR